MYECEKDPIASLNANVLPMLLLLKAAKLQNQPIGIAFAATATEMGLGNQENPRVNNKALADPITVYDLHKFTENSH